MLGLIKISLIFVLILVLLKRKIAVGYALLLSLPLFFLLYSFDYTVVPERLLKALLSESSIGLYLSLTLIRSFEYALRQQGLMNKMTEASRVLIGNQKLSVISMPLIIGMLPSLGGAYLSAPMVESATKNTNISKEDKAFINYWFRHPWELVLPLYPGIVLASTVSGVPLRELIILNLPITAVFLFTGVLLIRNLERSTLPDESPLSLREMAKHLSYFIPIGLILILVIVLHLELYLALLFGILMISLFYRVGALRTLLTIKYGFSKDVLTLVVGVMLFKEMLQISGAVSEIALAINQLRIPDLLVLVTLPFVVGVITGISVGFVSSTFPILLNLREMLPYELSIAFIAGYIGVLISPLHLCLILTREFFKADLVGVYRRISLALVSVILSALIEFALLRYYN